MDLMLWGWHLQMRMIDDVKSRIVNLFEKAKTNYPDVFVDEDKITLDSKSIAYIVGQLQKFCLMEATRDAVGDAFEVFIGHALKGAQGQFFTPKNVERMIAKMLDVQLNEKVIDIHKK